MVMAFFNLLILPLSFIPVIQVVYPVIYLIVNGVLLGANFSKLSRPGAWISRRCANCDESTVSKYLSQAL